MFWVKNWLLQNAHFVDLFSRIEVGPLHEIFTILEANIFLRFEGKPRKFSTPRYVAYDILFLHLVQASESQASTMSGNLGVQDDASQEGEGLSVGVGRTSAVEEVRAQLETRLAALEQELRDNDQQQVQLGIKIMLVHTCTCMLIWDCIVIVGQEIQYVRTRKLVDGL